jgi:hypothetical protein
VAEQSRSEVAVDAPDAARPEHVLGVSIDKKKAKRSILLKMLETKEEKIAELGRKAQGLKNKIGAADKDPLAPICLTFASHHAHATTEWEPHPRARSPDRISARTPDRDTF